jgi:hypothetical protein
MDDMKLYPQLDASGDDGLVPMPGIDRLANLKDHCFSLDLDSAHVLTLAGVYQGLLGSFERSCKLSIECELHGFERALKIVGIDLDMLKGVDTSL